MKKFKIIIEGPSDPLSYVIEDKNINILLEKIAEGDQWMTFGNVIIKKDKIIMIFELKGDKQEE